MKNAEGLIQLILIGKGSLDLQRCCLPLNIVKLQENVEDGLNANNVLILENDTEGDNIMKERPVHDQNLQPCLADFYVH